jgi:hypothetical protein
MLLWQALLARLPVAAPSTPAVRLAQGEGACSLAFPRSLRTLPPLPLCSSITENTRAAYPIEFVPSARVPCLGPHPRNILMLCCDAFGVLPPVSRLTLEQALYYFIR